MLVLYLQWLILQVFIIHLHVHVHTVNLSNTRTHTYVYSIQMFCKADCIKELYTYLDIQTKEGDLHKSFKRTGCTYRYTVHVHTLTCTYHVHCTCIESHKSYSNSHWIWTKVNPRQDWEFWDTHQSYETSDRASPVNSVQIKFQSYRAAAAWCALFRIEAQ